jgi:stage II sporulation protein M
MLILAVIAVIGYWASYQWAIINLPKLLSSASSKDITNLVKDARQTIGLAQINQHLSAVFIFTNNLRATILILLGGIASFSVLGMIAYLVNVGLVGVVLGVFKIIGFSPMLLFAAGLFPHGIFEIPALMLATAMMLRIGAIMVTPQIGKSMGQVIFELLADWLKVFLGVVVPLLAVAALIETYVTPYILLAVMK